MMFILRIGNFPVRKTSTLQVLSCLSLHRNYNDIYNFKIIPDIKANLRCKNYTNNIQNYSSILPLSRNHSQNVLLRSHFHFNFLLQVRHFSNDVLDAENVRAQIPPLLRNLSESPMVESAQNLLVWVHSTTGLPWWAAISLTAFAVRSLITLPLSINQIRLVSKLEQVRTEMEDVELKLQKEFGYSVERLGIPHDLAKKNYKLSFRQEWNKRVIEYNCHPFKCFVLVLIQLPIWISMSFGIKNLCTMMPHFDFDAHRIYLELMVGGFGWIHNLTDIDHYLILPITIGILNILINEMHHAITISDGTKREIIRRNIFRLLAIAVIPISSFMPAALNIYWLSSSFYGFLQTLVLSHPKVRKLAGANIDHTKYEHPYRHFLLHAQSLFSFSKKEKKLPGVM